MKTLPKILISSIVIGIATAHLFVPSVTIDAITITLLVLAALPWFLPYVKDFEIPGIVKISLPDTKAATDKLEKNLILKAEPGHLKITGHPAQISFTQHKEAPFDSLRRVLETEPNLALVGFRIEIAKRIIKLAEIFGISTDRVSLSRLVGELAKSNVISKSSALGLMELIALGNQAAHGADVTREAAEWVLDVGPSILMRLEDVEVPVSDDNDAKL